LKALMGEGALKRPYRSETPRVYIASAQSEFD
jgi:hypothetical protein